MWKEQGLDHALQGTQVFEKDGYFLAKTFIDIYKPTPVWYLFEGDYIINMKIGEKAPVTWANNEIKLYEAMARAQTDQMHEV